MEDLKLIIHIGMHKTATIFLQHEIFPRIENVNYIKALKYKTIFDPDKINIVSDQGLCGNTYTSGNAEMRYIIADRIKASFPNAKIIIGIREKKPWLKSLYSQYVRNGGIRDYNEWYEKNFDKRYLEFDEFIDYLKKSFKEVYVFDLNKFKKNDKGTIDEMCKFIGAKAPKFENKRINIKLTDKQIEVMLFLNKIWKSDHNPSGLFKRKKFFNPEFFVEVFSKYILLNAFRMKAKNKVFWRNYGKGR
jgi:hypothetical protein